ncbi:MAG: glycerophosphodiester phosphodiesterase [Clostridia bacterium]|nr:glycerophosphodiester phosphodiesterase [Clostridia bacterium]
MNYWKESRDHIYVAAHRGWCAKYPENTMEAFRAAIELGVDQIETDVRITKDGELVLIHDATLERTTNGTGKVIDKTLAELKELDAGSHKGEEFKSCRIPTFTEFMELVKDHPTMTLDLELKEYPDEGHEEIAYSVCDRVLAAVDQYGFIDRVVINTFSGKLHEYIQEKYGNKYRRHVYFPRRHLGSYTKDPYTNAFCCCMFSQSTKEEFEAMATKEEFEAMATQGIEPWAGAGVKDSATVDMAIERGATLITCNNPDVILQLLREKGKHQ